MSMSQPWWGVVVVYLLPALLAMMGASWAGRIQGRLMAFLAGFVVAFGVFAGLWLAGAVAAFDDGETGDVMDWRVAVSLVTIVAGPVGLLGGLVALIGSALRHPARPTTD